MSYAYNDVTIQRRALIGGLVAAPLLRPLRAFAQTVTPGPSGGQRLYQTVTSVGNGADITEDTLQTYVMPAGLFANVGDTLEMVASGTLGATTDNKTVRIRAGATQVANAPVASAGTNTLWRIEFRLVKRGTNLQTVDFISTISGGSGTTSLGSVQTTLTDTGAITWTVTGINATNPVAGSIACQLWTVDLMRGV